MNDMKYEKLEEMLCEELEDITNKGDLSAGDLDTVHKLTDTVKNIYKIKMLEGESGYSGDTDWHMNGTTYTGGRSYAGRRRDMRGRYSGRQYNSGYSSAEDKHAMMMQLEEMMDTAESDKTRDAIKHCMDAIKMS